MSARSEEFETYLAPGESVVAGTPGRLHADSFRSAGTVGVTDRRLLFVSRSGGFFDVAHEAVYSIRSHPRPGLAYRGMGHLLVAVLGAGVVLTALVGVLALAPSAPAFALALASVGGLAAAEWVRRDDGEAIWRAVDDASVTLSDAFSRVERLRDPLATLSRARARSSVGRDPALPVLGVAALGLVALVGLVAVTETLLVLPLVAVATGGLALAEYGLRRRDERTDAGEDRAPGRDVSIHLVDGRVVHLSVDPDANFERDLSAVVRGSAPTAVTAEVAH